MSIPDDQSRMLPVLEVAAKVGTSVPLSLYLKRLNHGRFIWLTPADGAVAVSAAQLGYLLDEGLCLTNNAAERELRGVALGRKAWLFAGDELGDVLARIRRHAPVPPPRVPPLELASTPRRLKSSMTAALGGRLPSNRSSSNVWWRWAMGTRKPDTSKNADLRCAC
jgi:hypothetical protein